MLAFIPARLHAKVVPHSKKILTKDDILNIQQHHNIHTITHILKSNFRNTYDFIEMKYRITLTNIFSEKLYRFLHNLEEIPMCKHCKIRRVGGFRSITEGYRTYCSKSCRAFDMQPIYKLTLQRKYGDEHYNNEKKRKITYMERYNSDCYFKSNDYREKLIKTYGTNNIMILDIIKDRIKKTSLQKYNTEYPNQSPIVQQRSQDNSFKFKPYTLPSGKIVNLQGYEHFAMNYLLKTHNESDIITDKSSIPRFWYTKNNKRCIYYADMFIKSTNTVVEIKSTWTVRLNADVNELKKQSVLTNGFNFEQMIFNNKGSLIQI